MSQHELPLPSHYRPDKVGEIWKIPYQERSKDARKWAEQYQIKHASSDIFRICLVAVDVQNTFCIPGFELYVGGRSGTGAIDDNRRLCQFIYRHLHVITQICPTMDSDDAIELFVEQHKSLPAKVALHEADFWNAAQADFLKRA